MKILIADDDLIFLRLLELELKKEGHQVFATTDGREAIKTIETNPVDLVITDIMMPFSSGLEIVAKVKSRSRQIPVIVLSSIEDEGAVKAVFDLGADDFIQKPLDLNELALQVNRFAPK